jgi:coenzyme Q-binding protein COQ10
MTSLTETRVLEYSAEKIYNIVMNIEKYPEFLPWCKEAKIVRTLDDQALEADLSVSFKAFFGKYRSRVMHKKNDAESDVYCINASALNGPFKRLQSTWKIKKIDDEKCLVEFFIDFEFRSQLLEKMIGIFFSSIAKKMIESFEARALQIRSSHT